MKKPDVKGIYAFGVKNCEIRHISGKAEMSLFEITDEKLKAFYHRAWHEAHMGFVDPRKYPYLDSALLIYAREHGCSYDEALILAKTGKKTGRLL